ncbi:MAG TPA: TAXI family TRAP transporter solute-binding subunit [Bacillota bacterium]|jgi:hypothetical protein
MSRTNRVIAVGLVLMILFSVAGCSGQSKPAPEWALATASSGSNPYVLGGIFSQVVNAAQKSVRVSAQVTPGWIKNLSLVDSGEMQLGQVTAGDLNDAYAGTGGFDKKYSNLRGLFIYGKEPLAIITFDKTKITSVAGLKGKKVHIGSPGSATAKCAEIVLKAHDLTLQDIKVFQFTTGQAIEALRDGQIDAAFVFGVPPVSAIQELAVSHPIVLIPIEEQYRKKIFDATAGSLGLSTITAGSYKGVDKDVPTVAFKSALMANANADPKLVYAFVKASWDKLDELDKMHHGMKGEFGMDLKTAVEGLTVPLHPGAEKYFKEIGVLK